MTKQELNDALDLMMNEVFGTPLGSGQSLQRNLAGIGLRIVPAEPVAFANTADICSGINSIPDYKSWAKKQSFFHDTPLYADPES